MFWAYCSTALGDVAHSKTVLLLSIALTIKLVQRMHVEFSKTNEEPRSSKGFFVFFMVTDNVASVLAQEAFDALTELLATLDIDLFHAVLAWF